MTTDRCLTVSVEEAAKLIGYGRTAVYEMIRLGQFPHLRRGRRIRIPVAALHEWVATETQPTARTPQGLKRTETA